MAFQRMTDNVLNVSALPNVVSGQASALKSTFDKSGSDLKNFINNFLDSLESSTAAENIGADVQTVATKTLQAILTSFEEAIADRYTKTELDTLISTGTNDLVADLDVNLTTGVITVTKKDGTTETFDTALEKVPAKFEIVETDGSYALKITNVDGTSTQTDITNLMNIYNFNNSDTVSFEVTGEGNEKTVVATIRDNSIGLEKLSLTVVSTLEGYMNSAKDSASAAKTSETNAKQSETNAKTSETNAAESRSLAANYALIATAQAEEAKKWAEQAAGSGGDLSGYYTKTETDAKIEEAIAGIEIPEGEGSIPKFVGTEENPIDFSDLFEGIGNATEGWYQSDDKAGRCMISGYIKVWETYTNTSTVTTVHEYFGIDIIIPSWHYAYTADLPIVILNEGAINTSAIARVGYGFFSKSMLFLDASNATEYTPTSDYNPATKKYVDDKKQIFISTIPVIGWNDTEEYYVDVAVTGMLESDMPHITPIYTNVKATDDAIQEAWNKIKRATTIANGLRVYAEEVPATEIPIQIEVVR